MTINLANLFFTPQTGGGTGQAPLANTLLGGGILAAVPGANFMDMIFARLNTGKDGEEDKTILTPQGDGQTAANDIMAMLTAAVSGQSQAKTKEQHVHLNNLLHKLAHEVSASVPAAVPGVEIPDTLTDDTDIAADWLTSILASLPHKDGGKTGPQTIQGIAGTDVSTTVEPDAPDSILASLPEPARQDFTAFLNHLLQGIPSEGRPAILKIVTPPATTGKNLEFDPAAIIAAAAKNAAVTKNTPAQEEGDAPAPALIATGLTPEGLTKFMEELASRLEKGESFVVGLVKIMPPQSKREVIFLPRAMVLSNHTQTAKTATAGTAAPVATPEELLRSLLAGDLPADDMPAVTSSSTALPELAETAPAAQPDDKIENKLLALLSLLMETPPQKPATVTAKPGFTADAAIPARTEGNENSTLPKTAAGNITAQLNALLSGGEETEPLTGAAPAESGFAKILKVLEEAQTRPYGKSGETATGFDKAVNVIKSMSPVLSTFHSTHVPLVGMAFASALSDQIFPDGYDWAQMTGAPTHGMTLNSPAMAASLIGQAPHAGNPHPATQMVAATITKAAASGENRNITVKLEPPELGRIEISMSFSKEKAVKTHMIVEKQETFMMMQRDAHILERALHDAGIDTDGGVSFELAQDGNMSGDGRNGERGASGGGSSDTGSGDEETIIETKMDWYIDPNTGAMRYDILA